MKPLLLPALALLLLMQCKKADPDPASQLPAATQTGANTFGCLLNGQPWTPSGNYGPPNFRLTYDPGYAGGSLQVKAYRFTGNKNTVFQAVTFGVANVSKPGIYVFSLNSINGINYNDDSQTSPCDWYGNSRILTYQSGTLVITRFDLAQSVIAGTFDFKLGQTGCDTIRITQGRFEYKL